MEERCVICGYKFTVNPKIPHKIYYSCTEGEDIVCPHCMPTQALQEGMNFELLTESAYLKATRWMKQ